MARKQHTSEDIIRLLRAAEVKRAHGQPMVTVLENPAVTAST